MRILLQFLLLSVHIILIIALKCKSDGGPKEEELRSIYMSCARRQEGKNMTEINGRSSWSRDGDRRNSERGWARNDEDGMGFNDGRTEERGYERDSSRYDTYNQNYRNQPKRYKRERRTEKNSGHRSQYNPNTSKSSSYEDYNRKGRNSTDSRDGNSKACVLHCFLEELEMTGDNGIPDRYLVTNVLTKNVKNEDLKDFLQESIEECFQILYNENYQDKCEFSKNLMMCLSEKGKANCDDWKDDIRF